MLTGTGWMWLDYTTDSYCARIYWCIVRQGRADVLLMDPAVVSCMMIQCTGGWVGTGR